MVDVTSVDTSEMLGKEVALDIGNAFVREQLAIQLTNKFIRRGDDPVAKLLLENKGQEGILGIKCYRDQGGFKSDVMSGVELEEALQKWKSQEGRQTIHENISMLEPGDQWPAGIRALYKKLMHIQAAQARGFGTGRESAFIEYSSLHFAIRNIGVIGQIVEKVIDGIISNPGTVIVRGRTMDILNNRGQGIRLAVPNTIVQQWKGRIFTGFIDSAAYVNPKK